MTSRRITREKFDAMVKEKVEVYGMTIDEAIERTIQQRQMQGPSRSLMTRAEGDGRFSSDNVFWRDELEPFFSRESDSDFVRFHTGHQHGTSSLSTGQMESHSFEHPGTSKPKFLHPGDKGKFYKGFLKGKPGKQSLVKGDPEWPFKTSRSQKKERKIDLMDESDIMSKFGSQIIKWAGFNTMQNDDIFKEQHMALFKVTTESCAKMLASYKCSIKEAQQEYCYFSIDNLKHPALKSPSVDNAFLSMLKENKLIKSRNSFIELLNPADNELMKVQARLLKAGIPLLMACNAYEIDQKIEGLHSIAQLSNALEKSISLCRKSLVLLGQTYAFVTSCRQEKILNIVGLSEKAPKPTSFPNLDDSALFGKEYLAYLKTWMEKTGCTFQLKKEEHAEEEQGETLIREEKKEINTSSSAGEQPTDLAAEEKCEAPTELPVEERKIPVLKTSEDLKDNPILLAIKERLDILQAGEERQDIPILQAIRERLSIPVLQAIKERLSESGSQAGGEKKIPADQTSTKEAEIPFLEANIKEAAIPFLDAGTKEAAIPFLDAGTKEAAIPFLDAGTKEVGIHFLDTGTEGAEIPFLDAGTKEAEIPVLQTPATEGKEIPVLQAREQRKKYISPKSFLRPPQTPALGSGQIQQFLSVRRGFPYKCTQTGVNLSNLLTFPRSNPNPTVCKANEGHSVAKSKDVKRTMYRSKSLHDKAERSSGPDSQPLQSEHLKAMDTIDHLMHNAVGISKRKLVDKEKPPFWFLFDENSMEYKYYRLKLAQSQKLRKITLEVGIQAKLVKAKPKVELSRGEATSKHRKLKRTSTATQTVLSAVVMLQARRAQVSTKLKPSPSEPAKVKQKPSTAGESLSKGHHRLEKRSRSELSCSSLAKRRKSDRHVSSQVSGSSSSSKALLETDYRSERRSHSGSSGSSRERSSTSKSHQLKKQIRASSRNKAPLSKLSHIKSNKSEGPSVAKLITAAAASSSQTLTKLSKFSKIISSQQEQPLGRSVTNSEGEASTSAPEPVVPPETLLTTQLLGVDLKTMDTAEKLAQFVAQVGPEIEKFSRENIANNPEFWFLNKRRSAAYRYYRMKVTEVCLSLGKSSYLEALKAEEDNLDHSESEESLTEEHMIMETQLSEPVIVKREMEEPKPGLQEHEAQDALLPAPKAEAGQVKEHAVEERKLTHSSEEVGLKEPKSEEIEQIKPEETPSLVPKAQEAPQPAPKDKEEREQMRHTEEVGLKEPKSEETEFIKTEEIPPLAPKTQETPQLVQKAEMDQVKECSVKEQAHTHNTEEAGLEPNSKETKLIKPEKAPQYLSKTQETSRLMPEAEAGQGKELEVEERKLTHNTEEAGLRELSSEETELIKTAEASQPLPKAQETPSPAPKAEAEQVTELTVEERELIKNSEEAELIKPEPKEPKSEETSSKPTEEAELKMELGSKTVETPAAEDSTPALESSTPTPVHYPVTRKRGQSMQQSVSSPKRVCATEEAQVVDSARTRSEKSRDRPGRLKTKLAGLESDSQAQSSPGMVLRKKGAKESPASTCAVKVGRTTGEGLGVAGKESMDDTL